MLMSKSRLEKFLYALYSLDSSDLSNPLSRIEELYKCLVTGEEPPTFEPLSRVEKYLMAILGVYDTDSLPNPLSRVEVLLYKLATGDDNLDDVKSFLSEHEELLAEIIRNGGVGGNIDIEYVLYTLSTEFNTLYNTAEKPVKSAILKGSTKYRDIDTGDILDTFDETKNLELVSVQMPVLTTTGKNLFDGKLEIGQYWNGAYVDNNSTKRNINPVKVKPNTTYKFSTNIGQQGINVMYHDIDKNFISYGGYTSNFNTPSNCHYINFYNLADEHGTGIELSDYRLQIEEGSTATPYEPYKSNILSASEEVELRGIGDLKDELDLMTGEVTRRIGVLELTGNEAFIYGLANNMNRFSLVLSDALFTATRSKIVSNNFYCTEDDIINSRHRDYLGFISSGVLYLYYSLANSSEEFLNWLSENPTTIYYMVSENTTETIDLITKDQDGNDTKLSTFNDITHVTLSSEELIPEAELEVAKKVTEEKIL